jgi:hypothetical protein
MIPAELWRVILRGLPDRLSHRQCERLILRNRGGRVVLTAAQREKQLHENPDRNPLSASTKIRHEDFSSSRPRDRHPMSRSFSHRLTRNLGHGCPNVAPAPPQYFSMLLERSVWLLPS